MANIPYVPIAVGAGVAAILGYLFLWPKTAKAATKPATTTKPAVKKPSGSSIGPISSTTSKTDWKMAGYRAGLAQGKADKAGGQPFIELPSRVVSGPKMPGTPGSTTSDPMAIANWTQGYADGYPVGFGKIGSAAPKYAVESVDEAGGDGETTETSTEEAPTETETETSTEGVDVATGLLIAIRNARQPGEWGTRNTMLSQVKHVRRVRVGQTMAVHAAAIRAPSPAPSQDERVPVARPPARREIPSEAARPSGIPRGPSRSREYPLYGHFSRPINPPGLMPPTPVFRPR